MNYKIPFIISLILVSCGKLNDKEKEVSNNISEVNGPQKIIAYNNALVSYMSEASIAIDTIADRYEKMVSMVANKKKDVLSNPLTFSNLDRIYKGISLIDSVNSIPLEKRELLKLSVETMISEYGKTKNAYSNFNNYITNDTYKLDNWSKGIMLVKEIKNSILSFYDNKEKSYNIIKPIAEKAEENLLSNHPLKNHNLVVKKDLGIAQEIVNLVNNEPENRIDLSAKIDMLKANLVKHKNLDIELLEKHTKTLSYRKFYKNIEDFLETLSKIVGDNSVTKSEADELKSIYERLIANYNDFD